ncbi:MAG: ATP-binding cassette domain-containing protein [Anaerolineae bacterium]|nr:ATP-binding cassette domain-containing protein [Anaerolineae bacterium]
MADDIYSISLKNVSKKFGENLLFNNLNLDILTGSITGISGPNGAGKSILLRLICGLVKPDSGEISVLGQKVGIDCEFPRYVGALIDSPGLLMNASAGKNLKMLAQISSNTDNDRINQVLNVVGLDVNDQRPVRLYSNGMRKRLGIAQAILEKPQVLILDEPTDAIDQAGWKDVYEYLIALKDAGCTILFSSNNLDEISILCDQAYILKDHRLVQAAV